MWRHTHRAEEPTEMQVVSLFQCFSVRDLALPFEELPQIRHATYHGTCYGTRTGQETTHKQNDRACVSRRFDARHKTCAHTTNEEPDPTTSERTNERATHKHLSVREGQNKSNIQP